jgi:hypothetical protein
VAQAVPYTGAESKVFFAAFFSKKEDSSFHQAAM